MFASLVTKKGLSASPPLPAAAAAAASDRTGRGRREVKQEEGWRPALKEGEAADGINAVVAASLPKSKVTSAVDLKNMVEMRQGEVDE